MSGVPWHSPLGGLIEARGVLRVARKSVENEKAINGHIAGNPYDVAISALNFALGSLDGVITPAPDKLDAATIERCKKALRDEQDRLDADPGDYLMDTADCINVLSELLATDPHQHGGKGA